jgi:RNA polymerase sigma-70 factor (ECF subfamily)
LDEKKLIKLCSNRDQLAQHVLFEKYYNQMYHLARRYVANHHDTEDVLIEAFNRILNNIQKFDYRGEHSLTKWIKTIVINESIRFLNQRKKIQFENDLDFADKELIQKDDFNEVTTENIYKIIENLPAGYRTVFNLYVIEEYSHKDIAEILGISQNTSKSQLSKARRNIINELKNSNIYGTTKI